MSNVLNYFALLTDKVETTTLHHVAAVRNYLIQTYSTHGLIQYLHRMIQRFRSITTRFQPMMMNDSSAVH